MRVLSPEVARGGSRVTFPLDARSGGVASARRRNPAQRSGGASEADGGLRDEKGGSRGGDEGGAAEDRARRLRGWTCTFGSLNAHMPITQHARADHPAHTLRSPSTHAPGHSTHAPGPSTRTPRPNLQAPITQHTRGDGSAHTRRRLSTHAPTAQHSDRRTRTGGIEASFEVRLFTALAPSSRGEGSRRSRRSRGRDS